MSVSTIGTEAPVTDAPARRVRHLARESLAVMAFSAVTSVVTAGGLLLITSLAR